MNIKISCSIEKMLEEHLSDIKREVGIEWSKKDFLLHALKSYNKDYKYPYINNTDESIQIELPDIELSDIELSEMDKVNLENYIQYFIISADSYLDEFVIAKAYY